MSATPTTQQYSVSGVALDAPKLAAGLYLVATPIGNLKDITLRALETLAGADLVLCEDTRHSARLLNHYAIKARKAALHAHNEQSRTDSLVSQIQDGAAIALISDAGTPLLSDPGFPLVRALRDKNLPVFAIPGPSALLAAVTSSGLPVQQFGFIGFLPPKAKARLSALEELAARTDTLVFYESPRRLAACLAGMAQAFGPERQAAVALELTKRFERVANGSLSELAEKYADEDTKGEAVIVVAGAEKAGVVDEDVWKAELAALLENASLREAVDQVSSAFKIKRKSVYDAALALKNAKN